MSARDEWNYLDITLSETASCKSIFTLLNRIIHHNLELLLQVCSLIDELKPEEYAKVGPHFRHISDHYEEFFNSLSMGAIDFDRRARDCSLESDKAKCYAQFGRLMDQVNELLDQSAELDKVITIQTSTSSTEPAEQTQSSVPRELQFLHTHTVHHLAIIKLVLKQAGVKISKGLGVAPSTLKYQSKEGSRHAA